MLLQRLRLNKKQAACATSEHRAAAPHCTRKDTESKNSGHVGADYKTHNTKFKARYSEAT